MHALKTIAAAGLIASSLALAPAGAQAQAPAAGSGFDGYRVLAVTAGVIAGAAAAVIVTDGLIIPVYAYATGAGGMGAGGISVGSVAASGMGAVNGAWNQAGQGGYMLLRGSARMLGAIGGGFYADSWYTGR